MHAATPRMYFPNIYLTWSVSNWSTMNAGSRSRQCCHSNTINLNFIIFFVQHAKNSWKIIAFNYITMNFRNMYCRYVVLHFVSFDLFKDVRCETRIHIKSFKRSLVKNIYLNELSTASLQSSTGRLKWMMWYLQWFTITRIWFLVSHLTSLNIFTKRLGDMLWS